jgi:hypothetical protein
MIDFLNITREKYYLSLGEYKFSPIMEASIALAMSYNDLHIKSKQKSPFYFNFPDKNDASIWLSLGLLTNYFLDDYINYQGKDDLLNFRKKDKVEIFGVVAEIEHISSERLLLNFSDQGSIPLNKKLRQQIKKTNRNLVNTKKLFFDNYKEAKKNRNPISKILEPSDESAIINETNLSSKVLLITGRGNVNNLRTLLKSYKIYGEPLKNVFVENKNLLIKKDLESFKYAFDLKMSDKEMLFKQLLLNFLEKTKEIDGGIRDQLKEYLDTNAFLTNTFKDKLDDLIDFYGDDFPDIIKIYDKYPGINDSVPENIKAVIINDIEQIDLYKEAVNGFLKKGVSVFVVSDRHIQSTTDINIFDNYFSRNPDALRINWNRKKINAFNTFSVESDGYLDSILWQNCLRYSRQNITITVSESCPMDKLLYESQKFIKTLDGFELVQESYYKHLFPAAYLFKNSSNKTKIVVELVDCFDLVLQENKMYLEKPIQCILQETVDFLKNSTNNSKYIGESGNVFSNAMSLSLDQNVFIPTNTNRENIPDGESESIIFTGYPYNEFFGRYLIDSVCYYYVPEIEVICWPIEADLTYNYLKRRIFAGYFADNLRSDWNFSSELLLNNSETFLNEIDTFLTCSKPNAPELIETSPEQENDLQAVFKLKYREFEKICVDENNSYRVKCNILNFSDGSFLFLPKNGRILAQTETDDGSIKLRNSSFAELEIGLSVFKYKKDRKNLRWLAKNNEVIKKAFTELELWKNLLQKLYLDNYSSIDIVEAVLLSAKSKYNFIGGNPVKNNIQRWLYDEELIAPEIENIRIILAASECIDIDKTIGIIGSSKSKVEGYTISLSASIKKRLAKIIEKKFSNGDKEFKLDVDGVQIEVESRIITSLEKNEMEIEYYNTHKILI